MINRRHVLGLLAAATVAPSRAFPNVGPVKNVVRGSLAKYFSDCGTEGTFVAYRVGEDAVIASDNGRSAEAILPASTFMIACSVIALETGVVADPDKDVFGWDGVARFVPEWNKDHTLRSAMAVSAVPVYQEISRRIGVERMQNALNTLDYGNRSIGGGIENFWLTGDLRIDPVQQVDFVDRLRRGVLPVAKRSQELTRDILPATRIGDAVIRSKTGLIGVDDKTDAENVRASVGWLVGWAEKGERQTVFALNIDIREAHHKQGRMRMAEQCLTDIGAL